MESTRHYLGWDRPVTVEFADRLKAEAPAAGAFDHCLVWVPSSRAGRHILNRLFSHTTETEAVHPPRLVTPGRFVGSLLHGREEIASKSQCLYAWKTVLDTADPALFEAAFPVVPERNRASWAFTVGQQLMQLRERLAEDLWDFQGISQELLPHDRDRWTALARLEAGYLDLLRNWGLKDPDHALRNIIEEGLPPQMYSRLMVVGILNLSRRQAACVEALSRLGLKVDTYLPIPVGRAGDFDQLGRPKTGVWDREPLPEGLIENRIQRSPDPRELVQRLLELGQNYGTRIDSLVVGSPERDLADYLIERSRLTTTPFYAPEGRPLSSTGWGRLMTLIAEWQKTATLGTLFDLLNHAYFREWAERNGLQAEEIQCAIQEILKDSLLHETSQLFDKALGPSRPIGIVREFVEKLESEGFRWQSKSAFPENLWKVLVGVANSQDLDPEAREILGQIEELLQDLRSGFDRLHATEAEYRELLEVLLANTQHYPERVGDERPVSGWLELPWESAPHVILLSLPESQVPGPKVLDSFLTPSLCRLLGLYGPEDLASFHAFRLRLILESRREWGRVDILLPDRGLDDSPVLPSRFLFLAEEADIIQRVDLLLSERPFEEKPLPAEFGTALMPPSPSRIERISVTALRGYLSNPFHFYLQNLNRWSAPEALPREMDAMGFGHLAHQVLEALNTTEEGLSLKKEKDIAGFLLENLQESAQAKFGNRHAVSIQIQLGSLAERLRTAAGIISLERLAGWLPEKVEWGFHDDLDFRIEGVVLRGVIDLLEKNTKTGEYRIIDYKTSDKATLPEKSHLTYPNARSQPPLFPECEFADGNKTARWKDLQLPLYQKAVEMLTGEKAICAYFNLSKAVGEIGLAQWRPGKEQQEAAILCAGAIVKRIQNGEFPIGPGSSYEDKWIQWFGGNYDTAISPEWRLEAGGTAP